MYIHKYYYSNQQSLFIHLVSILFVAQINAKKMLSLQKSA